MKDAGSVRCLCNGAHLQTIAISCRCGLRWTEKLPTEFHDAVNVAYAFDCVKCGRVHILHNHHMKSLTKEEYHDRFKTNNIKSERFGVIDANSNPDFN